MRVREIREKMRKHPGAVACVRSGLPSRTERAHAGMGEAKLNFYLSYFYSKGSGRIPKNAEIIRTHTREHTMYIKKEKKEKIYKKKGKTATCVRPFPRQVRRPKTSPAA